MNSSFGVPSIWENNKLESLCKKITDGTHKTPDYKNSGIVFISAKNIREGKLDFSDHKYISYEEHELLIKRCKPEAGDVMLSKSGSLGDSVVIPEVDFEFSIFESLALMKVKKKKVSSKFLTQIFNSPSTKRHFWSITTGLAVKHLHLRDLRKMSILLPPLPEQKAIADLLSTWDKAIEKTERLIQVKRKRLNGLYQHYFVPQCSSNMHWEKVKIGKVLKQRNKKALPSDNRPLFSLTIEDGVTAKTDRYNREALVKDNGSKKYKIVCPNDIVFNPANLRWGAIARSMVPHEVVISPIYEVLSIKNDAVDIEFISHLLTCPRQVGIYATKTEGTLIERMAVKLDAFLLLDIYLPPEREEQQEISSILNAAQYEINLLKQLAEKYKTQKRGLMQKMLTGEWRIKPNVVKVFEEQ